MVTRNTFAENANKSAAALDSVGRSASRLVLPLLGVSAAMSVLGGGFNEATASGRAASSAFFQVQASMYGVQEALTRAVLPIIEEVTPVLASAAEKFVELDEATNGWTTRLLVAGGAAYALTGPISGAVKALGIGGAGAGAAGAGGAAGPIAAGAAIGAGVTYVGASEPEINDWLTNARGNVAGFGSGLRHVSRYATLGNLFSGEGRERIGALWDEGYGAGERAQNKYDESSFLRKLRRDSSWLGLGNGNDTSPNYNQANTTPQPINLTIQVVQDPNAGAEAAREKIQTIVQDGVENGQIRVR